MPLFLLWYFSLTWKCSSSVLLSLPGFPWRVQTFFGLFFYRCCLCHVFFLSPVCRNIAGFLSCGGSCMLSVQSEVFITSLWDADFSTAELQADFSLFLLCENWVNFVSLCTEIKKKLFLMMECNSFYKTFFSSLFSSVFGFTNILVSSQPAWSGQRYLRLCYM